MDSQFHFLIFIFCAPTCESPPKVTKNVMNSARRLFATPFKCWVEFLHKTFPKKKKRVYTYWKKLYTDSVSVNKKYATDTLSVNKKDITDTPHGNFYLV